MILGLPKPVHAVVLDGAVEGVLEPFHVIVAEQSTKMPVAVEWRVADDDAGAGPADP
jgi:hypothetical protein